MIIETFHPRKETAGSVFFGAYPMWSCLQLLPFKKKNREREKSKSGTEEINPSVST